jgi:hypothetical protein
MDKKKVGRPSGRKKIKSFSIRLTKDEMELLHFVQKRKKRQIGKLFVSFLERLKYLAIRDESREIISDYVDQSIRKNKKLSQDEVEKMNFKRMEIEGGILRASNGDLESLKKYYKEWGYLPDRAIIFNEEGYDAKRAIDCAVSELYSIYDHQETEEEALGFIARVKATAFYLYETPKPVTLNIWKDEELLNKINSTIGGEKK